MKKGFLVLVMLLVCASAQAQCVGEVKNVYQDTQRGSIIVETQYTLNGQDIQLGRTRYLETSGTNAEIIQLTKDDIAVHCKNLIARIEANQTYINNERVKRQKELTQPIIDDIKSILIGYKDTKTEASLTFKEKDIKVTYDSKNTISDTP